MMSSMFSLNAHAWTVATQGIIAGGSDPTGIFGMAREDLSGLSFSQVVTVSTDPTQWSNLESNDYRSNLSGTGPAFTSVVTVDGKTVTFSATSTTYGSLVVAKSSPYTYDAIGHLLNGTMSDSSSMYIRQFAYKNPTPFISDLSFDQTLSLLDSGPSIYKEISFNAGSVNFFAQTGYSQIDNFSVNPLSPVPEPATYAMMLGGLAVVGFVARRKQKQNAPHSFTGSPALVA